VVRPRFTSGDHPLDAVKLMPSSGPIRGSHERKRTAAGTSRRWSTRFSAASFSSDTPHPEIRRPIEVVGYSAKTEAALRQHLIGVMRSVTADVEYVSNERDRHPSVKQVGHRVDKDRARIAPTSWLVERLGMDRDTEARTRSSWVTIVLTT
jgi:hypothetical protein